MIRTTLLQRLMSRLRDEAPTPEAIDRGRRRALLAAGASAASCAFGSSYGDLAPARPRGRVDSSRVDVAVVGAGLAGLVATWRLRQRGVSATLYEASGRVGGRAFTSREVFPVRVELGGEFVRGDHRAVRGLAAELGVGLVDLGASSRSLAREQILLQGTSWSEDQAVSMLRPLVPLVARDLAAAGAGPVTWQHHTPGAEALDQLSLSGWMERNGVSGAARALLEAAFASEHGVDADRQSALPFLWALGRAGARERLFAEDDRRYVMREGSDALARALESRLGPAIQRGNTLVALRPRPDGRVRCVFDRGAASLELDAARVVLALPFSQLRRCEIDLELPSVKRRAIRELAHGTGAKVVVGLRGRPWGAADGASITDGGIYHESWDSSRGLGGDDAVLTAYSGGRAGVRVGESNPEAQGRRFIDAVDVLLPGTANAFTGRAARMHWSSARFFEGSFAVYGPGDVTRIGGAEGFAVGRVHFAGEHTSARARASMEGAVESGERAAAEVLAAR